jgi:fatty-acyl-CoA synthase
LDYINVVKNIVTDIEQQDPYHIKSARLPQLKAVVRINDKPDFIKGFVNYTDISQPA